MQQMNEQRALLEKQLLVGLNTLAIQASSQQVNALLDYLALLLQWNQAYNLTAIRNPTDMLYKHLLDSLAILPFLHGHRIIDIGTGAGLPGIPLAIFCPDHTFVLLDSNRKKIAFLTEVLRVIPLPQVKLVHMRCESFNDALGFTSVLTRAFSSLSTMISTTAHLWAPAGKILAMKGDYPTDELDDLPTGFTVNMIQTLAIPGLAAKRHLVTISRQGAS